MWIEYSQVNATQGYHLGESVWEEIDADTPGEAYCMSMHEFGRCSGKMYIDHRTTGQTRHIGWVFEKRVKYDDVNEYFKLETWVSLHEARPTITKQYHYLNMP